MKIEHPSNVKASRRRILREVLQEMDPAARERASAAIVKRLKGLMGEGSGELVLLYAALPMEANVWEMVVDRPQFRYALPRMTSAEPRLEVRMFSDRFTDLLPGLYGIEEPDPAQCPLVPFDEVDWVLVPGLAFSHSGQRLGRGGGFYDRLLGHPEMRARTVGVCFDCQVQDELPVEGHDQGVDVVLTEHREFRVAVG